MIGRRAANTDSERLNSRGERDGPGWLRVNKWLALSFVMFVLSSVLQMKPTRALDHLEIRLYLVLYEELEFTWILPCLRRRRLLPY
jgi:hypothetical protein